MWVTGQTAVSSEALLVFNRQGVQNPKLSAVVCPAKIVCPTENISSALVEKHCKEDCSNAGCQVRSVRKVKDFILWAIQN